MIGPETRQSLILNLRDPSHHEAWEEFVDVYSPLVYRLAIGKGLQHADAADLCQEVLAAVGRSISRFDPDRSKGSFRGWLFRIARNLIINVMTRSRETRGSGDSAVQRLLEDVVDQASLSGPCSAASEGSAEAIQFDLEYQREVFRWAADRVREKVETRTWKAFWMTAVEGKSAVEVATILDQPSGTVRVARCRVLGRIKREVEKFDVESDAAN